MSQEQRVWLASILSAAILVAYAQVLNRSAHSKRPSSQTPIASQQPVQVAKIENPIRPMPDEELVMLESGALRVELGKRSGVVRSLVLKRVQDLATKRPLRIGNKSGVLMVAFADGPVAWHLRDQQATAASWVAEGPDQLSRNLDVELDDRTSSLVVTLTASNREAIEQKIPVKTVAMWTRGDALAGRYNLLEEVVLTKTSSTWQRSHLRYLEGIRWPKSVPRGTMMVTLAERFFCQSIKLDPGTPAETILLPSERGTIAAEIHSSLNAKPGATVSYKAKVYFGPRDFFSLRDAGFEQAFPLGFLAKIGLVLMVALKAIASLVRNYGIAVILLAAGVTAILSPFTLISVRSMKRMQELQPRMDQLKKKHADDPKRMNQEVVALFKEHKVSPLSGCLPMFLQLPVFFALWSSISHVIELRGARFLWIKDLSLPDRLARLPHGVEFNLLPILMAAAMFFQTKLSQPKVQSSSPNPFSGPMMSVIFGVMFYQVPSGLVLYWLTNSLTSILWYKVAKV